MNRQLPISVSLNDRPWQSSPSMGVLRIPLEREEAESGWVTSVVRYVPNSHFSAHSHPLGEEILVLNGVFSDEHGNYPAGTYLRNPPGSSHSPFSQNGCDIFVKLNQFSTDDNRTVAISTLTHSGLQLVHHWADDDTYLLRGKAQSALVSSQSIVEVFVAAGNVKITTNLDQKSENIEVSGRHWLRLPSGSLTLNTNSEETSVLIKVHQGSVASHPSKQY